MKILIYSPAFYPSIGGLETVISNLAHEFLTHNCQVKVVSQTPAIDQKNFPFEVIRRPNATQLLKLTRWCDLYFQACVSLKGLWPMLLLRKPLVVTHQTWYFDPKGRWIWQACLKNFISRFATNISPSHAIAKQLPSPVTVIPNSYQDDIFYLRPEISRNKELVFLGRLVSDKGADLLLDALASLKKQGLQPTLTIIGQGTEETKLRQQVEDLNLISQVNFVGVKQGQTLAELLNAHQILVVPSRWQEPFGIVALEGIACGCVVVGSEQGGLKDAIGPCGVTFPNGDVEALSQKIADLLNNPNQLLAYKAHAKIHLLKHTKGEVTKAYIKVFQEVI
ncbi:MAG TPA: glycosyltransferase family 4 protein [Halomicronema sp.]